MNIEDKPKANRIAHPTLILGCIIVAGLASYFLIKRMVPSFHLMLLKLIAFPFLLVGIKMHPAERPGIMAVLANAFIYMIPFAIIFFFVDRKKINPMILVLKTKPPILRSLISKIILFIVLYIVHFVVVILLFVSGLVMVFGVPLWVLLLLEADSNNATGTQELLLDIAYNTIIFVFMYSFGRYLFWNQKE